MRAGAIVALVSNAVVAQPARGRIAGTMTEKVASRSVAMATISVTRDSADAAESREVHPDAMGRYSIEGLAPGRYIVHVTTPLLDSLELSMPDRVVNVASGETARADYALPFGAALRDAVCPGLALDRGKGVISGHARDADTDLPLASADVAVAWSELTVDRATLRSTALEHAASVRTGARGEYRLCDVPTSTWVSIQLQKGELAGSAIRVMLSDLEGAVVRDLSMSLKLTAPGTNPVEQTATRVDSAEGEFLLSGTAGVSGVVRGAGNMPLSDAQLRVQDGRAMATTDSAGRFYLTGLPDGTQILLARHLGYTVGEFPVELRAGKVVTQDVQLVRAATLDTIVVSDYRSRYREFEFNRGMYFMAGDFMTAEMIARRVAVETGDLVDRMPGFAVIGHGNAARAYTRKSLQRNSSCQANVVVDGVEEMGVNDVPPNFVQGIEVYVSPPKPPIYHRPGCGVVVIWTKNWRRPTRPVPVIADTTGRTIQ